jgi:hypothetical protein
LADSAGAKTSMAPLTSRTSNCGNGSGAMGSRWASSRPVGQNDVEWHGQRNWSVGASNHSRQTITCRRSSRTCPPVPPAACRVSAQPSGDADQSEIPAAARQRPAGLPVTRWRCESVRPRSRRAETAWDAAHSAGHQRIAATRVRSLLAVSCICGAICGARRVAAPWRWPSPSHVRRLSDSRSHAAEIIATGYN